MKIFLASAMLAACTSGPEGDSAIEVTNAEKPNIILLVVDTLRADALAAVDTEGNPVAPNIQALAKKGVTYKNAHSTSGWTLPGTAGIMTGDYPWEHHVTSAPDAPEYGVLHWLTHDTLAEVLALRMDTRLQAL